MKKKHESNSTEKMKYSTRPLTPHEMTCRQIFDDIENGGKIYISVDQPMLNEGANCVRISLLSDQMLKYDDEMFRAEGGDAFRKKYRPYFASFIVPLDDNSLAEIASFNEEEHLNQSERNRETAQAKPARKWYVGRFMSGRKSAADDSLSLSGILVTSASPVSYIEGRLLKFKAISSDKLCKINGIYDPSKFMPTDSRDIESILTGAWKGDIPKKIDIYNVGHGNADYIRGAKQGILYDIGYNYRSIPRRCLGKYQKAAVAIRHLKPSCVILSHWDLDHIIGCAYAEQDIFNVKWIAPHLVSTKDTTPSPNSVRLAQYLNNLGNLHLVDRVPRQNPIATIPCANNVEMRIWLGSGTDSKITAKNREGLLIEIIDQGGGKYPHVLLAGDVPYACINSCIMQTRIDFMHVPHHCSNMNLDPLENMPGGGKCAVISTNRKKDGCLNCSPAHHSVLQDKFGCVWATIVHPSGDDSANLSIEITYNASGGVRRRW